MSLDCRRKLEYPDPHTQDQYSSNQSTTVLNQVLKKAIIRYTYYE